MSIKSGYGNLTETLESLADAITTLPSNRNSVIQLPSKLSKRIFSITVGYRVPSNADDALTQLFGGRLLVVGTKFQNYQDVISPLESALPDSLNSANVYLDVPIIEMSNVAAASDDDNFQKGFSKHFDFNSGIIIPESVDASVILTFCANNQQDVLGRYPESAPVIAYLNVQGFTGGNDKIFKNA